MDGLLVVDKPQGPTSHDVVARMRRVLREKAIGHTGTLDPMATGVLLLVLGKATRLAKFLTASDKSYDAVVRLGFATDTADALGQAIGPISESPMPSRGEIDAALDAFRGTFMQRPPAFSAKKIDGQRSYKLARKRAADARLKPSRYDGPDPRDLLDPRDLPDPSDLPDPPDLPDPRDLPGPPALPAPASVTAHAIRIVSVDGDQVTLGLDCSAGFYVRSLAHDLGERLGIGGHLAALRRTRTGGFGLDHAITLDAAERDPAGAAATVVPLAGMLSNVAAIVLTASGVERVTHGRDIDPRDRSMTEPSALSPEPSFQPSVVTPHPIVRLLDPGGNLIAIGRPVGAGGLLHPSVVLV